MSKRPADVPDAALRRFLNLLDHAPIGLFETDVEGNCLYVNKMWSSLTGLTIEQAAGQGWVKALHPEDKSRIVHEWYDSAATGREFAAEYRFVTPSGVITWVAGSATALKGPDGSVSGYVGTVREITDRIKAEEIARATEERFSRFMQNIPGLAWIKDGSGRYLYANEPALRAFGKSTSELYGRTDHEIFDSATADEFGMNDLRALTSTTGISAIETLQQPDGILHSSLVSKFPIPSPGGEALVGGIAIDVTAQLEAEERLRDSELRSRVSEERYRAFIEHSSEGIWRFETREPVPIDLPVEEQVRRYYETSYLAECNDAMARMYGFDSASELVGKSLADLFVMEDTANRGMLETFVRSGYRLDDVETHEKDRLGSSVYFRNNLLGIVEDGRLVRAWGTQRDITAQRRSALEMSESEERFRLALDAGNVGIWDWHIRENRVTWSDRIYEFHGLGPEGFGGRVEDFLNLVHPGDRERLGDAVRNAMEEGAPYEIEFRAVRPNGDIRWLLTNGKVIFGDDGKPLRMLGATVDVTERRTAEEALQEAARRKDEFLAMLAHELRNPLAPILNGVQILRRLGPPEPVLIQQGEMIERQVIHMKRLLDDLLDVSRITRRKIRLELRRLDVARLLHQAAETVSSVVGAKRQNLTISVPGSSIYVTADETRLTQVITNLLQNAAKYTEDGGRIDLIAESDETFVTIRVKDTGIGMSPAMLQQAFELFSQAERALDRSQGGLGIGLTIVKELVEMHGGSVSAHSAGPGRGSTFTVRIPAAAPQTAAGTIVEPAASQASQASLRILVVDDNADSADSLGMLLRLLGHDVRMVYDGPAALSEAERFDPDIVLLDIGIPEMDGYQIARRLRAARAHRRPLLVAVTGYGQEEDRQRALDAGFDHHLTKPVEMSSLEQLLRSTVTAVLSDRNA